jgi:hypothetical protein
MRRTPSPADQRALLKADIATTREEKVAAMRRIEAALHDELRALEMQYQARAAAQRAKEDVAVLDAQLDEQLEALTAIPKQRKPG